MNRKERRDKHLEEIEKVHQELQHCEEQKEKWEKEVEQLEHRIIRKQNQMTTYSRKARTKRLIERGAILESVAPSILNLPNESLKTWLEVAVSNENARAILEELVLQNLIENPIEDEEEPPENHCDLPEEK